MEDSGQTDSHGPPVHSDTSGPANLCRGGNQGGTPHSMPLLTPDDAHAGDCTPARPEH